MDKIKLTREEALRRWKASKEIKRKMSEKLEHLVRDSCKKQNETNKKKV
ncbi:protein tyrosine phosphatase [Prevotella sp.]|nr:protein tyrosine phosphatase [Prevotella sp.]